MLLSTVRAGRPASLTEPSEIEHFLKDEPLGRYMVLSPLAGGFLQAVREKSNPSAEDSDLSREEDPWRLEYQVPVSRKCYRAKGEFNTQQIRSILMLYANQDERWEKEVERITVPRIDQADLQARNEAGEINLDTHAGLALLMARVQSRSAWRDFFSFSNAFGANNGKTAVAQMVSGAFLLGLGSVFTYLSYLGTGGEPGGKFYVWGAAIVVGFGLLLIGSLRFFFSKQ